MLSGDPFRDGRIAFAHRQDFATGFGHEYRVLPLCGERAVLRHDGPTVTKVGDVTSTGVEHRFDREDHAGTQDDGIVLGIEVRHERLCSCCG